MKKFIYKFIMFCLISFSAYSFEYSVNVEPKNPIAGENFELVFKIRTTSDSSPYISFNPGSSEVKGRGSRGTSIRTTIINGEVKTTKEVSYVYELLAHKKGLVRIRDISVEIDGVTKKKSDKLIDVLKVPRRSKEMFVIAVPSKLTAYVGEAIDINYYFYFKNAVRAVEVAKFPVFNKFIKRFFDPSNKEERVNYNGEIYRRIIKYTARLYPEKAGKAYIDPLKLNVQYVSRNTRRNPFSSFGMAFSKMKMRTIQSKKLLIEVLAVPTVGVPKNFTGLIGEHSFTLETQKNKFIVNEPLELKLVVEGPGALENLDAPILIERKELEVFDTKGEIDKLPSGNARKTFNYTMLTRAAFIAPSREIKLSYFDSTSGTFKEKTINFPKIEVSGASFPVEFKNKDQVKSTASEKIDKHNEEVVTEPTSGYVSPIFRSNIKEYYVFKYLNIFLIFILFLLSALMLRSYFGKDRSEIDKLVKKLKSKKINYSDLFKFLSLLNKKKPGDTIQEVLEYNKLEESTINYFLGALDSLEKSQFGNNDIKGKVEFSEKHFKLVAEKVTQIENENN